MSAPATDEIVYPESDGAPLGEGTVQVGWIVKLFNGFRGCFRRCDDVFVAADLFWYPVQGEPKTVQAPDVMIAFGRPKGDRGSYRQWEEGGVAPQVVFEVLSPSNTRTDRDKKLRFYDRHAVEEYYEYDPEGHVLQVWLRRGPRLMLAAIPPEGFVSPRLGVRFVAVGGEPMQLFRPDGAQFRTYLEILDEHEANLAAREADQQRARLRERLLAQERERAETQRQRADALAAKLRALGIDPDAV